MDGPKPFNQNEKKLNVGRKFLTLNSGMKGQVDLKTTIESPDLMYHFEIEPMHWMILVCPVYLGTCHVSTLMPNQDWSPTEVSK